MKPIVSLPKSFRLGVPSAHHAKDDATHVSLSDSEQHDDCIGEIHEAFRKFGIKLPHAKVFRYARICNFNAEAAIERIREDNYNPYLNLQIRDVSGPITSRALYPIPQLRTRKGSEVIYMRPSRFNSTSKQHCDKVVESLCYVLNDLSQTEEQCRHGVAVIFDMKNVTKENFSKDNCKPILQALQGNMVPTRVVALLIVSPPAWFGKYIKSNTSNDFYKKVHIVEEECLSDYLMDEYQMFLPESFRTGLAKPSEIAEDYVDLKTMKEQELQMELLRSKYAYSLSKSTDAVKS